MSHHSLEYKQMAKPNKKYKELKQKQKQQIAEWMFEQVCLFWKENNTMLSEKETDELLAVVYQKICNASIWIPYDEVKRRFISGLPKWEERIRTKDIPEVQQKPEKKHNHPKPHKRKMRLSFEINASEIIEQDETFYYIAGYTSGGAPYGVTWEEMGLEPFEDETDEFPFDDV